MGSKETVALSSRQLVRSLVGLAVVAPAVALLGLAVAMAWGGGASGVFAGVVVAGLALLLLGGAFVMTHAPVSIANLLGDESEADRSEGDPNGQGSLVGEDGEP